MTKQLSISVLTPSAIASNNRGEGDGSNLSTLQTVTKWDDQYTTVSADAIRWAYREYFQNLYPEQVNRTFDHESDVYNLKDEGYSAERYIDDDLFGYMFAGKDKNNKPVTKKRRGQLEVTRAISLDPYWNDTIFNSTAGTKSSTSLHKAEVHHTAYQYTLALTPSGLKDPNRANLLLEAIPSIKHVGGNHARFLYEFRPESIVVRITNDFTPWIIGCFERVNGSVGCPELVWLVENNDIRADELIIGGKIVKTPDGEILKQKGVKAFQGIKECIAVAQEMLGIGE